MNTNPNLVAAFTPNSRDNPCFGTDPTIAKINVFTDDEHSYHLLCGQFLFAEFTPNPALERDVDAPPEKLPLTIAVAEIVVFGSDLKFLKQAIQKYELKFVRSADRRHVSALKAHVAAVAITFTKGWI